MILRHAKRAIRVATLCAVLAAVAGCNMPGMTEQPYLRSGDINGAEVAYETDRALADNVAQRHCAQYNRVARFIGRGPDTARYECDER